MGATDTVKFFAPEQAAAFLSYIEMPYTVYVHGHKRFDYNGQPYIVGNYTATRAIPEQIRILYQSGRLKEGQAAGVTVGGHKPPRGLYPRLQICYDSGRLERLRKAQEDFIEKVGDYWQGDNWVFNQDNGKIMSYSTPYHALQDTINRYNKDRPADQQLPLIPFHGFPHTYQPPCSSQPAGPKDCVGEARPRPDLNDHEHLRPCSPGERPQGR